MTDEPMTDSAPPAEEPEYIPDPEKEKQAKALHFTISIVRLLGVGLLVAGIVVATGRMDPIPRWPGYILVVIALLQMWAVPVMMVRQYVRARVAEEEMDKNVPD